MKASDRVFGLILVLLAAAYIAAAQRIEEGFMIDPVGSRAFPTIIGVLAVLCGLAIMLRPDAEPEWPDIRTTLRLVFALVVLIGYAYALHPWGFVLPTFVAAAVLSYMIEARPASAALTGAGLALGLFAIFKYALGLGLVALPRALMG